MSALRAHPAVSGVYRQVVGKGLVESFSDGVSQPLDLILDHQLAALQLDYLHIVGRKVHECVMQFIFENFVFTLQFNEVRLYCHYEISSVGETSDSIRTNKCTQASESVDGYRKSRLSYFRIVCNQS
jgi:penicillin-binding protein-related factor A (putative recombinase)